MFAAPKCTWARAFCFALVLMWKSQSVCGETTNQTQTSDLELRDPDAGDLKDDVIRVGGLFESKLYQVVFQAAIDIVNEDSSVNLEPDILPVVDILPEDDSYEAVRDACRLLEQGVAAIFGPMSGVSSVHVSSVCDSLNVPHLETRWDPFMEDSDDSINIFPHPNVLAEAYTALMKYWEWNAVAILYDEDDAIVQLKDLLQELREDGIEVSYFFRNSSDSFRDVLKKIKEAEYVNIFVAIEDEDLEVFLKQAMQIEMLGEEYNYLFMSLDFHVADLSDFIYAKANITALRIVDVEDPVADIFQKKIDVIEALNNPSPAPAVTAGDEEDDYEGNDDDQVKFPMKLETENAMLYDAVKLFALSIASWGGGKTVQLPSINCRTKNAADATRSSALRDIMKKVAFDGLTGTVKFDEHGFRKDFQLYVTELGTDGLEEIGTWSPTSGLNITKDEEEKGDDVVLRVVVISSRPFVIVNNDEDGSPKFSGFCVDLLQELSAMLDFKYELHASYDGRYGSLQEDGQWNGMVGELTNGNADLAMADLTITEQRERVVDFTLPFMSTGLAIVTKKGEPMRPGGIWSFFLPLTREVWVYVILATTCTIFVMYIGARLSFREWTLVEDGKGEECMENRFNLFNCFLFVVTTLLHQRITLDPRAPATRVLAGFWYFFTFIILAIIVSNLCESILWEDDGPDYDTAQELLRARGFTYVVVHHGSSQKFLQDSKVPLHQRISSLVERNYRNLPTSVGDGLQRVKDEDKVAFVMETASAAYATQEDCNFSRTDPFVFHSAYGFATPRDSPYRSKLSEGILKLQENGRLQWIQQRWWNPKRFCDSEEEEDGGRDNDDDVHGEDHSQRETVEIRQLHGADLAGAFAILYMGLIIAGLLAIGELFYVFSTRANRDTHLNSIAVSDHMKQAGFVWKRSMDLSDMRM
ncbi:glutamate receptor ionotropic, kainate 2 [Ixodes scapularis]